MTKLDKAFMLLGGTGVFLIVATFPVAINVLEATDDLEFADMIFDIMLFSGMGMAFALFCYAMYKLK